LIILPSSSTVKLSNYYYSMVASFQLSSKDHASKLR
jgi:hypothetical protein